MFQCKECGHRQSLRYGSVMQGSKLPFRYWFIAMHLLTATKHTFSAAELQRQLGHNRYQPIWEMVHKLRSVMGQRDSEYMLTYSVELDEGFFTVGTPRKEEKMRQGSKERKATVLVMAESVEVEKPNPEIYKEVNHLDENPSNDRYDNLEWCTHKNNCNYGTRIERIKSKQSIPILQYTLNGDFIAEHKSMHEAAESINADAGHICDCCLGNRKWAYGFFWRYKDDSLYENAKQALDRKIKLSKESRREKIAIKCGKPIEQYSKDGSFIAQYPSTRHASEATGICRVSIINASNGKLNHAGGYIWKNA